MDDDPSPARAPNRARPRPSLEIRVSSAVGTLPLGRARVIAIAERVLRGERCHSAALAISFVGARQIARLNRTHLGHHGSTDILTFEHSAPVPGAPRVGDVYICPEVAARNAEHFGASTREELARLVIHGVLHALGWDHPDGEARLRAPMWRRQERWLRRLRDDGTW